MRLAGSAAQFTGRTARARAAAVVDRARDELLARAGLAHDQDRGVGAGDLVGLVQGGAQHRALAHDLAEVVGFLDLRAQVQVLGLELAAQLLVLGERGPQLRLRSRPSESIRHDIGADLEAFHYFGRPLALVPERRECEDAPYVPGAHQRQRGQGPDAQTLECLPLAGGVRRQVHEAGDRHRLPRAQHLLGPPGVGLIGLKGGKGTLAETGPLVREPPRVGGLESLQHARVVEVEELGDLAEPRADLLVHCLLRQVNEVAGEAGNQGLEVEGPAQRVLRLLAEESARHDLAHEAQPLLEPGRPLARAAMGREPEYADVLATDSEGQCQGGAEAVTPHEALSRVRPVGAGRPRFPMRRSLPERGGRPTRAALLPRKR